MGCHGLVRLLPLSDAVAMLHGVAQAVAVVVLPIRDLSVRWGPWRSDAAGAAQCGSGEAALSLLLILSFTPLSSFSSHSLYSVYTVLSSPTAFPPPRSPLSFSLSVSVSLQLCCSSPLLHLVYPWFSKSHGGFAAFGCSDLVKAYVGGRCDLPRSASVCFQYLSITRL